VSLGTQRSALEWHDLGGHFRWCWLSLPGSDGLLARLDRPVGVVAQRGVLLTLSVSSGVVTPETNISPRSLAEQVLAGSEGEGNPARFACLRQRVWDLFEQDRFGRTVPHVMVAAMERPGVLRVWRAGPNGIAVLARGRVRLESEDLRVPALRGLGVDLSEVGSTFLRDDELLASVTDFTQLEPEESRHNEIELSVERGEAVLMLSRGAFPFAPPGGSEPAETWWSAEAGWRHGMSAYVVVVANGELPVESTDALLRFANLET